MQETSRERLNTLKQLAPGGYDGSGEAFLPDALDWLAEWLEGQEESGLPYPWIYGIPDGKVSLEWDTPKARADVHVNLETKVGSWMPGPDFQDEEWLEIDMTDPIAVATWRARAAQVGIIGQNSPKA